MFGTTEAGACVTTMPAGRELDRNGTIGLPVLYARCRVGTLDDRSAAQADDGFLVLVDRWKDRLAGYKVPSRVRLVDELPRNATGNVLKGTLREAVADAVQPG